MSLKTRLRRTLYLALLAMAFVSGVAVNANITSWAFRELHIKQAVIDADTEKLNTWNAALIVASNAVKVTR